MSSDKGKTWNYIFDSRPSTEIVTLGSKSFVAVRNSFYVTENAGLSWEEINLPFNIVDLGSFGDQLYAMTPDGCSLRSSFDGYTWFCIGENYVNNIPYHPFIHSAHDTYFRDANFYYSFQGNDRHTAANVTDNIWFDLPSDYMGSDYIIHDNVIYLGGEGMYKSDILNPYVTSVQEIIPHIRLEFVISPNPATENLYITFNDRDIREARITVTSADGMVIKSQNYSSHANTGISIQDLPNGIYIIHLVSDRMAGTQLFVKQ